MALEGMGYDLTYDMILGNNCRGGRSPEDEEKEDGPHPKSPEFLDQVGRWTNTLKDWLYSLTNEQCLLDVPLPREEADQEAWIYKWGSINWNHVYMLERKRKGEAHPPTQLTLNMTIDTLLPLGLVNEATFMKMQPPLAPRLAPPHPPPPLAPPPPPPPPLESDNTSLTAAKPMSSAQAVEGE